MPRPSGHARDVTRARERERRNPPWGLREEHERALLSGVRTQFATLGFDRVSRLLMTSSVLVVVLAFAFTRPTAEGTSSFLGHARIMYLATCALELFSVGCGVSAQFVAVEFDGQLEPWARWLPHRIQLLLFVSGTLVFALSLSAVLAF